MIDPFFFGIISVLKLHITNKQILLYRKKFLVLEQNPKFLNSMMSHLTTLEMLDFTLAKFLLTDTFI